MLRGLASIVVASIAFSVGCTLVIVFEFLSASFPATFTDSPLYLVSTTK
jgi:hypothetical protein